MPDPTLAARSLSQAIDSAESRQISEAGRDFIEELTFATADEILTMLRELLAEDWMALPPWARNLATYTVEYCHWINSTSAALRAGSARRTQIRGHGTAPPLFEYLAGSRCVHHPGAEARAPSPHPWTTHTGDLPADEGLLMRQMWWLT
ncbi:hypothetical protein ACPXCP_04460 [Streptomyces sp. DT20]|uniref:hypothetical protein n=1 Tax=unclassified Streptomyces TaxID=2593676 RepID=UPI00308FC43A|nr:hypothetical protein OG892_33325 [Streptomyces sp. NBC_00341]